MPVIELNILVVAALVIVPALIAWISQRSHIQSLKSKVLDHEYDLVKTNAHILELEKEVGRLKKDSKTQQTADVIAIDKSTKSATG